MDAIAEGPHNDSVPSPCTARHVFDEVGKRLGLDAELLAYLFSECMDAMLAQTEHTGACTVRKLGRLRRLRLQDLLHDQLPPITAQPMMATLDALQTRHVLVFDRPKRGSYRAAQPIPALLRRKTRRRTA